MILIAVPGTTVLSGIWPAATIPITDKLLGFAGDAPTISACITAYPSIPELASGGSASGDLISSAKTCPMQSNRGFSSYSRDWKLAITSQLHIHVKRPILLEGTQYQQTTTSGPFA